MDEVYGDADEDMAAAAADADDEDDGGMDEENVEVW